MSSRTDSFSYQFDCGATVSHPAQSLAWLNLYKRRGNILGEIDLAAWDCVCRLGRDYERLTKASEDFVYVALIRLMLKQLART